jgi:hypothetical protein
MYYLTLGAIFRHENCWLDEWIRYHHMLGVEHFYLYNHDDDTHVSDMILRPYVEEGLIDYFHVSEMGQISSQKHHLHQCAVIQDAVLQSSGHTQWLGLVDLDEFILPRKSNDIRNVLEEYENYSSLVLNWANFGSSGYIKRPQTQINHFLHRATDTFKENRFVKSIVRPETIDIDLIRKNVYHYTPHKFVSTTGDMVDEHHRLATERFYNDYTDEVIRINHYIIRSYQDYWDVKVPRGKFTTNIPRNEKFWSEHDRNEVFDDEISRRFGHLFD